MQAVENRFKQFGAKLDDISLEVEFHQDQITLDFPNGNVMGGWKITPMAHPVVSRLMWV